MLGSIRRALHRTRDPSWLLYHLLGGPHPLRLRSASERALPDFLVIGAMRAGSSSIYRALCDHPQVLPAQRQEIRFLDDHYKRGVTWYRAHFPRRSELHANHALTGEEAPHYLFDRRVPARAAALLPEARMIAVLRHPVRRAYSHYWHQIRSGHEKRPFAQAVGDELNIESGGRSTDPRGRDFVHHHFSYLARGRYLEQIDRWLSLYPRDQLQLILTRDLERARPETLNEVAGFLGLPAHAWSPRPSRYHDRALYPAMDPGLGDELRAYFHPYNERLALRFGLDLGSWNEP